MVHVSNKQEDTSINRHQKTKLRSLHHNGLGEKRFTGIQRSRVASLQSHWQALDAAFSRPASPVGATMAEALTAILVPATKGIKHHCDMLLAALVAE